MRNIDWFGGLLGAVVLAILITLLVALVTNINHAIRTPAPVICVHQPEPNVQVWVVRQGKCESWEKQK